MPGVPHVYVIVRAVRGLFPILQMNKLRHPSPTPPQGALSGRTGIQTQVSLLLKLVIAFTTTPRGPGIMCLTSGVYCYLEMRFYHCFPNTTVRPWKVEQEHRLCLFFVPFRVYCGSFLAHSRQSGIPAFVFLTFHRRHDCSGDINPAEILRGYRMVRPCPELSVLVGNGNLGGHRAGSR